MKMQVTHDEQGHILSVAIVENGVVDGLSIVPKQNQSTKVVDIPSTIGKNLSSEEDFKRLGEEIKKYKVDISSKTGKLIRKSP